MWGTSSPDEKLTGDLGNAIEPTKIAGRRLDRLMAGKLSPLNCGLLQQYLPLPDSCGAAKLHFYWPLRRSASSFAERSISRPWGCGWTTQLGLVGVGKDFGGEHRRS